jgi:hypothetical protein
MVKVDHIIRHPQSLTSEARQANLWERPKTTMPESRMKTLSGTGFALMVMATDFSVIAGASVRMVMDVGAWDNSVRLTPAR